MFGYLRINTKSIRFISKTIIQSSNSYQNYSLFMAHQTLIKINLEHNISSLKIPELKVDSQISVLALKEII